VLVTGESGTGKELAAAQLHAWSARAARPFVSVNAACFAPSLLESELFGHEAGAFTGATSRRAGLFELASGGTLFLDEVGELPLELQPKLLRVLEGHPFRRVGGERPIVADVRVVSATNCRMAEAVAKGRFRLDLYHRLRVVEVPLPPLRERGADAELLAIHFVSRLGVELGKPEIEIAPETLAAVRAHTWPGNVRELKNAMERAIVLNRTGRITPGDLPGDAREPVSHDVRPSLPGDSRHSLPHDRIATPLLHRAAPESGPPALSSGHGLDDIVKRHVLEAYQESAGNLARAARALGIGRATLRRRLRDYGVTLEGPARHRRA
jgi:DNA-binding NtrC family response regulator